MEQQQEEQQQQQQEQQQQHRGVEGMEAVFLGALAPGVNKPTWRAFKSTMVALCLALSLQLAVAVHSESRELLLHVVLLSSLAAGLFILLNWFISQTGLVTSEQQERDLKMM